MWSAQALVLVTHAQGQSSAGDVNLDLDATTFVQVGLFVVLFLVLKPMLFDPMLKLFEERERHTEGKIKKARDIDDESAHAKAEYDETLQKSRVIGNVEREKIRSEGLKQEAELLASVRAETAAAAEAARKKAQAELAVARGQLKQDAAALAQQAAGIVIGREVRN